MKMHACLPTLALVLGYAGGAVAQEPAEQDDTHVTRSEQQAVTGPTERTDAEIVTEERLDPIDGEQGDPPSQAQSGQQGGLIDEAQAADLVGRQVVSSDGEDIGEISEVVRSRADQQLYALVELGGLLGVGGHTVSISLENARSDEEGNVAVQMSRDQVESMEEYDPEQYASIDDAGERTLR